MISNALAVDYTDLPDNAPTILYIQTVTPAPAALTLNYPQPNVTQGGNIGFALAGVGLVRLSTLVPNIAFFAGDPGALNVQGRAPTLVTINVILPDVGTVCQQL